MELSFRPMREKDLERVLAIEQVSYPSPWSRYAFISEIRENQFAHYYVCLAGRRLVGYAGMWIIMDEAHITNLAVHPAFRQQGVGEKILYHLMGRSVLLGAERMTLEVRVSNDVAKRLYNRVGFEPSGIRKGYYIDTREDALIMWLVLPKELAEASQEDAPGRAEAGEKNGC